MHNIWETVHSERQALIADLKELTPEQWQEPSLCKGWTVHDVLAHLVNDAKATKVSFIRDLIMARFNFDKLNESGVIRERQANPQATLHAFAQVADRTTSAPAPLASRLVEIIVHGEDIRRPLGIQHSYPVEAIIEAIQYQLATSDSMGGSKDLAAGLRLIATDASWEHGDGDEVQGNVLNLLLALTGRQPGFDALTGDGARILRGRRH